MAKGVGAVRASSRLDILSSLEGILPTVALGLDTVAISSGGSVVSLEGSSPMWLAAQRSVSFVA